MKPFEFYSAVAIIFAFAAFLVSCKKEEVPQTLTLSDFSSDQRVGIPDASGDGMYNTFYGATAQIGDGHMRSWVNISREGMALAIGVEMTDKALDNLPHDVASSAEASFILPLHQKAKELTPYDHIEVDWNEYGHEPPGIYDLPHFDFHFYMISLADQLAIPAYVDAPELFDNLPPSEYLPPLYFRGPGGIPEMGVHWVDLLSPEFSGQIFTSSFLYGTYNGKVTFHEPMVTMEVIRNGSTIHKPIRQPQLFSPQDRFYPTQLSIWEDVTTEKHFVSLNNMVLR